MVASEPVSGRALDCVEGLKYTVASMRMQTPTASEIGPTLAVVVILTIAELVVRYATGDLVLAAATMTKALAGLGIVYALYQLAPWVKRVSEPS